MTSPDPTGLGTYLSNWATDCDPEQCKSNINDATSVVDSVSQTIAGPIVDTITNTYNLLTEINSRIGESVDATLQTAEVLLVAISNKIHDTISATLSPIVQDLTNTIRTLQQTGYVPTGPAKLLPDEMEVDQGGQQTQETQTAIPGTGRQGPGQTVPTTPLAESVQRAASPIGPQTQTQLATTMPSEIVNALTRSALPTNTIPTSANPFWVLADPATLDPNTLTIVTSNVQPKTLNVTVYGPFYSVSAVNEFIKHLTKLEPSQPLVDINRGGGNGQPCPVIVTINCPPKKLSKGQAIHKAGQADTTKLTSKEVSDNLDEDDDNLEYYEWILTQDASNTFEAIADRFGLTKEVRDSYPDSKFNVMEFSELMAKPNLEG